MCLRHPFFAVCSTARAGRRTPERCSVGCLSLAGRALLDCELATAKRTATQGVRCRAIRRGANSAGQLGDGTTTSRLTPAVIAGNRAFLDLTAGADYTCGLLLDFRVVCFGKSSRGRIALQVVHSAAMACSDADTSCSICGQVATRADSWAMARRQAVRLPRLPLAK